MAETFIKVDGLRIRVSQIPSGTNAEVYGRRPFLLINGLGSCLEAWQPLTQKLSDRDLIMVDHPGTGLSQTPDQIIGMSGLATLYRSVLDELRVDRVDVLGYSFGGAVAQQFAHDYPHRTGSLILAATSCGWGGVPADFMTLLVASNPLRYQFAALRQLSAPFIFHGRAGRDPGLFRTDLKGMGSHRASLRGVYYQVAAYSSWSSLPWLSSLRLPALVMAGCEDPMAPVANARLMAASIPGAGLRVFPWGGHLFLFDQAAQAVPVISRFLDREGAVTV